MKNIRLVVSIMICSIFIFIVQGQAFTKSDPKNSQTDFMTDVIAPSIDITYPREGDIVNASIVTIQGNVSDLNSYASVEIDGIAVNTPGGAFSYTLENLTDGVHRYTILAKDEAGNVTKQELSFVVEVGEPVFTITCNPDKLNNDNRSTEIIVKSNEPLIGIPYATVTTEDGRTEALLLKASDKAALTYSGTYTFKHKSQNGNAVVFIRGIDEDGFVGINTSGFKIDTADF